MKLIVALPYRPWPPHGGAPMRSWQLTRHLAARHEVHVFVVEPGGAGAPAGAANLPYASTTVVPLPTVNPARFSPAWAVLRMRSLRHPAAGFFRRDALRMFAGLVQRVRPEGVIYGFSWMLPYAVAARDVGALVDEHNYDPQLTTRMGAGRGGMDRVKWALYEAVTESAERRNLQRVRGIAAVSEGDAAAFRRIAPHAIVEVVPNGVDIAEFTPAPPGDQVVMTGSYTYGPNVEGARRLVARIWPLVRAARPAATLRLVGLEGRSALADLAGAPGVTVVGTVPDVRPELARARVAVAPLDVGGGTRIKILEAFAMARAVVATSLAAEGLAVRNDEHLMIRDDDAGFAAAIVQLLDDAQLAERMGRTARLVAEALYDWKGSAATFEDLVRRVVG